MHRLPVLALIVVLGTSCDAAAGPALPVDSVELSSTTLTLGPTETQSITATARAANGEILPGRNIVWGTSDPLVATVSNGVVTAHAFGAATIAATVEGKSAQGTVTVTATQPAHLAAWWRMQSFDGKTVPGPYLVIDDYPMPDGDTVDVVIRLDSAKMQLAADGKYPFRQYCFTETHDGSPAFKYCWGDHGQFTVGNPPGRVALVSDYIQNLSAFGSFTGQGTLAMVEELYHGDPKLPTIWARQE